MRTKRNDRLPPLTARLLLLIICFLPCAGRAFAQAQNSGSVEITAQPNRPTFSTTAEPVQRGVFEIEYGFEAADGHQNINGLLKFAVFKNLEFRFLHNPVQRDGGVAGLGDCGAGFKYRFVTQTKWLPTLSFLYNATFPTGAEHLGTGAVGHSFQLLSSKDFGKHHVDLEEAGQILGRPGARGFDRNYFTALAYSYQFTKKWGMTAELAGTSRTNRATPANLTLLAAPTYSVSSRLVFDAGAYIAGYGSLPRVTFFGGVTYSVVDLYHLHRAHGSARKN